jgi:6-phosphofructokinase 1
MDVLMIQDGGCAPGYNPVTAFLTEYLEKAGRKVFMAAEGFRSVVTDRAEDYRCLIHAPDHYRTIEHIPGVIFAPPLRESSGADFRSERFPDFKESELQKKAAKNIANRKVSVVIAIGGNGTFMGIKSLSQYLPENVQTYFIPVTIDSDIYGTECIGENTGVEMGAEKIRCYMADARTHHRCYIIEMMGREGGYHALHSCLGAGAHLAVLPSSVLDLPRIANAIDNRTGAVVAVAEGYKSEERKKERFEGNAAEYFMKELVSTGVKIKQRIVCEPFSRDIRGARPNNMDIMLAQRMARKLVQLVNEGKNRQMPAVLSGKEYHIPFEEIRTDNSVESTLATLANRLY